MHLTQIDAYLLTFAVEGSAAFALAPLVGMGRVRAAVAAVLGSAVTHPIVWAGALALYPLWPASLVILLMEAFAAAAETVAYRVATRADWARCALISISVNALSWGLGVVIQA